jgi:hypothetical protein
VLSSTLQCRKNDFNLALKFAKLLTDKSQRKNDNLKQVKIFFLLHKNILQKKFPLFKRFEVVSVFLRSGVLSISRKTCYQGCQIFIDLNIPNLEKYTK